jgi:hypothetical protein
MFKALRATILPVVLGLAALGTGLRPAAADDVAILERQLTLARGGDPAAMRALVGLVHGDYIRSAEGGEWLNAVYLELLLEHPEAFLSVIGRADKETRERAVAQLLRPVHDAYSGGDLLAAVRYARTEFYSALEVVHRESIERTRRALGEAVEACEHWGGEEPYDEERAADIMAGFERDCPAALELARESYWTSPSDPVIAAMVTDLLGYLGPLAEAEEPWSRPSTKQEICDIADFFYRAMTKYYPRSRVYFEDACPAGAAAFPKE